MMRICMGRLAVLTSLAGAAIAGIGGSAHAVGVTLQDTYWGGINYYNNNTPQGDVIGPASVFGISSADVGRTSGGNTLDVVIHTAFAGRAGTPAADGTGYGALFFRTGGFTPSGTGPEYNTDVYQPGRFNYAFVMPENPGSGDRSENYAAGSTAGGLFEVTREAGIEPSNVYGNPVSYPNLGNPGYYFRQGQAVQYDPAGATARRGGSWAVSGANQTITFSIIDNGLLGSTFALAWAVTCANDIILGNVTLPSAEPAATPLPAALPLFAGGAIVMGFLGWRRQRKTVRAGH